MATDASLQPLLQPHPAPIAPQQAFDCWGRPIRVSSLGGWKAASFLLGANSLQSLAMFGCTVNLVIFLVRVLQQDVVAAANAVTNWFGTTFLTSLIGASLGDAWLGRLWTSIMYQVLFVAGLIMFAMTGSIISQQPPKPCFGSSNCELTAASPAQVSVFYIALYMVGLGTASLTPNLVSLGADQLDSPRQKSTFISLFMSSANVGMLVSITVIAYLENEGQWSLGFWLSCGAGILALLLFLAGMPNSRHYNSGENSLFQIARVLVAAARNRGEDVPSSNELMLDVSGESGQPMTLRTDSLRWLDKAAPTTRNEFGEDDCHKPDPWRLCTVAQVEEVKKVCRLLPFWVCGILLSAVLAQKGTLFMLQGATMDNRVGSFEFPPSSMGLFSLVTFVVGAPLYSVVLVPCIVRCRPSRRDVTSIERMGAGLVVAIAAMSVAAIVEWQRLKIARKTSDGGSNPPLQHVPMSIFWLVPQYVLEGLTGVLFACGHVEFNYSQSPEGMRSLATAISLSGLALGNYLSSAMVQVVTAITSKGGRGGWIPKNLEEEEGHLDYFYWLLDVELVFTLVLFVMVARWHGGQNLEDPTVRNDGEPEFRLLMET